MQPEPTRDAGAAPFRRPAEPGELALATYNVHRFVGRDRRYDPDRVVRVISELGADVVALQEFVFPGAPLLAGDAAGLFPGLAGYGFVAGLMRYLGGRLFGNALLVRPRVLDVRRVDLTVRPREFRAALDVDLEHAEGGAGGLRVVATHLGLRSAERRVQLARLIEHVAASDGRPLAVMGDFNEWRPNHASLAALRAAVGDSPGPRSFPTPRPLLALDRIFVRPAAWLADVRVHKSALAEWASDHFPVVATLRPPREEPPGGR